MHMLDVPLPADTDLFGEPVEQLKISRRRMESARQEVARTRRKMFQEGSNPMDVLGFVMMKRLAKGDEAGAVECATILMPYMFPRLTAVSLPGASVGVGSEGLRITWEAPPTVIEEPAAP